MLRETIRSNRMLFRKSSTAASVFAAIGYVAENRFSNDPSGISAPPAAVGSNSDRPQKSPRNSPKNSSVQLRFRRVISPMAFPCRYSRSFPMSVR